MRKTSILFRFFKELITPFSLKPLLMLFPVVFMELAYMLIVQNKHGFSLNDRILVVSVLNKIIFDSLLFLSFLMFFFRITFCNKVFPVVFMSFYLFLLAVDSSIYYFGNTIFEKHHLSLITWYSIKGFVGPATLLLLFIFSSFSILSWFLLRKTSDSIFWRDTFRYFIILFCISYFNFPKFFIDKSEYHPERFKGNEDRNVHFILRCKNAQIIYISQNPLVNFVEEVFFKKGAKDYKIAFDTKAFEESIQKYKLPLGRRAYERLDVKPFNRIVWFASESVSLDFFSAYNKDIPFNNAPYFYNTDEISNVTMLNYFTSGTPTLQGLTATFNSHPNTDLILSGYYDNSLPGILKKVGYKTIFLRSASKYFADENIVFQHFKFDEIVAREYFQHYPEKYGKYIYDWGVSDRILYNKLEDILNDYRNEKIFIVVLGIDTHPPEGRIEYGYRHLYYPFIPKEFNNFGSARKWMISVRNHDYDLGAFYNKMKLTNQIDESTLFIFTADHACPYNSVVQNIKGHPKTNSGRIPLVFKTAQKLPEINRDILSSQLDLAPTILHLLNLPIPQGYWGESLFSKKKIPLAIGSESRDITIFTQEDKYKISTKDTGRKNKNLIELYNTVIYDKEIINHRTPF